MILNQFQPGYASDPNAPLNFPATVGQNYNQQEIMNNFPNSRPYRDLPAPAQQFTAGLNRHFTPGPDHHFTAGPPQGFDQNFGPGPAFNDFPAPGQGFGAGNGQSANSFPPPSQIFNAAAVQPFVNIQPPGPASRATSAQSFAGMQSQYHYQGQGPGSRAPSAQGFAGMPPPYQFQGRIQGPGSCVGSAQGFIGIQPQYQGQDQMQGPAAGQMMMPPYQSQPHRVPSRMASVGPRDQIGPASGNDCDNFNNLNPVVERSFTKSQPTTANAHVGPYSFDVNGTPPFVNMMSQAYPSSRAVLKIGSVSQF